MKNKKALKIISITLSVLFVLSAAIIIHIAMIVKKRTVEPDGRQLSRIDFTEKVDSVEANKIRNFVAHLDGVESTYFNVPDGILIYTYSLKKQNSKYVYKQLMNYGNYKANRFIVNASEPIKGCPAMSNDKSFVYTLATYVSKLLPENKSLLLIKH